MKASGFLKIAEFFKIAERGSSIRIEVLGGVTTFASMAYIIVVNPAILQVAGIPIAPSTIATILTAVFGCVLMGLLANRPIAVAPYMGENAFIAFGLSAFGLTWQERLGSVFVAGVVFLLITLFGLRQWLAESISKSMKHAFAVGIGLFLSFIGLYETGIIASGAPAVPVKIGDFRSPDVLLAILGFLLISFLLVRKIKGAILLGIILCGTIGILLGRGAPLKGIATIPFLGEYSLEPIAFHLDILGVLQWSLFPVLLTLVLMAFLDTTGTLLGLGAVGGMLDEKGEFPEVQKPMFVDALSCMFAALVGTSTSGAYIESATGIREGARTGLAALVTGGLFFASLFFIPLIEPFQSLKFAYYPALIVVGALMMTSLKEIETNDWTEVIPAFATIALMVFTYNIADGLTAGLLLYPIMKAVAGKYREIRPGMLVLAGLCLIYYLFGLPH
ncbi:MAG TPA: NCS2 family permease [Fimbriimonadales bacterium]|nr:NCS2 family permease [Fimbriimonadales bacterium]